MRFLFICTFLLLSAIVLGQNESDDILIDLSESFADEENTNIDFELLSDEIDLLSKNKIELNSASMEEWLRIPGITQIEAESLLLYRKRFGPFLSLYELKCVEGLTEKEINRILPYVYLSEKKKKAFAQRLRNHESDLYLRYDRTFERKKGYSSPDSSRRAAYLGDPNHYYLKYKSRFDDLFSFGFAGEKDAGESVWNKEQKVFDFQSAFLQINNVGLFKRICIGDYKANFGQGLVIGTSSIIGKSNNVLNSLQRNRGIFPYTSIGESGFLRGGGATLEWKRLNTTLFYSHKKIDANLSSQSFITSFKTDGLHRTENELAKKEATSEKIFGSNISYNGERLKMGGTFLTYHYGDTLCPTPKPYNRYKLSMTDRHWNASADYSLYIKRLYFFGEVATDANQALAYLNGCRIYPSSRAGFLIIHRHYSPQYQANYANGFSENSHIENEEGLYIGSEFKPLKRLTLSLYADAYTFPWLRYSCSRPHSSGYDYLAYLSTSLGKRSYTYMKFKEKRSEKDQSGTPGSSESKKQILRYGIRCRHWEHFELQTLAEGNRHQVGANGATYGWMAAQDFDFPVKISRTHLKLSLRYAYFHTPHYDNRIYLYEKDILHVFSIPCHYGIGHKSCVNLQWNVNNAITCYMKYGICYYTDGRETIGSGNEEIKGCFTSSGKILLKLKF